MSTKQAIAELKKVNGKLGRKTPSFYLCGLDVVLGSLRKAKKDLRESAK